MKEVLAAATEHTNPAPFDRLLEVWARPFDAHSGLESYAIPAPTEVTVCYKTFCGT